MKIKNNNYNYGDFFEDLQRFIYKDVPFFMPIRDDLISN